MPELDKCSVLRSLLRQPAVVDPSTKGSVSDQWENALSEAHPVAEQYHLRIVRQPMGNGSHGIFRGPGFGAHQ